MLNFPTVFRDMCLHLIFFLKKERDICTACACRIIFVHLKSENQQGRLSYHRDPLSVTKYIISPVITFMKWSEKMGQTI